MESKALRELTALYLDSVYDEGYKPYPKEKVDKQKDKAYEKEMIARGGKRTDAKDKEADKQYERRMAMDGHPSKMRKYEEDVQREDFINKLIESGKFSIEEIEKIVESRLDKDPPSQFGKGDDDRGNPDYMHTSSMADEEKWERLQRMRRKSKKASVRAKAEETDQLGLYNSLIESGKFSEEEIEKIVEAQVARNNPEKYERDQEKKDTRSKKQKRMDDPHIGINSPAFKKFMQQQQEEVVNEEGADRLKDRRMERGGVDGNVRYDKAPGAPNTFGKKPSKKYDGMSAVEKVKASIRAKYGQGAIIDTKKK